MKKKIICAVLLASVLAFAVTGCSGSGTKVPGTTNQEPNSEAAGAEKDKNKDKSSEVAGNPSEEAEMLVVDYQYYSEEKNKLGFTIPKKIERNGKQYEYTGNAEYTYSEIMDVVECTVDYEVEEQEEVSNEYTYVSDKTGKKYVLKSDIIRFSDLQPIKKKITEKVFYGPSVDKPSIPKTKTITYYNRDTQKDEECEGELVNSYASDPYWLLADEPIRGEFATDALRPGVGWIIGWEGEDPDATPVQIPLYDIRIDEKYPSWEGYEDDVIKWVGADPEKYRVVGAWWDGEVQYSLELYPGWEDWGEKVVARRYANYPFEALVQNYSATYVGYGDSLGYKARVTYYATVEEILKAINEGRKKKLTKEDIAEDLSVIYKVTASASYREIK